MSPYGGDKEARTPDPLLAKQVLSQLSYTPTLSRFGLLFRGSLFQKTLKIKQYLFALLPLVPDKTLCLICLTP